jgi:hypothetical protein
MLEMLNVVLEKRTERENKGKHLLKKKRDIKA